jgi:hypothetical protein
MQLVAPMPRTKYGRIQQEKMKKKKRKKRASCGREWRWWKRRGRAGGKLV